MTSKHQRASGNHHSGQKKHRTTKYHSVTARDAFTSDWNSATEKITDLIKRQNTGADDAEQALKLTGNPGPHCNELLFVRNIHEHALVKIVVLGGGKRTLFP